MERCFDQYHPFNRSNVSPGKANGAKRIGGPGVNAGEPEHPGVLPSAGKQCVAPVTSTYLNTYRFTYIYVDMYACTVCVYECVHKHALVYTKRHVSWL